MTFTTFRTVSLACLLGGLALAVTPAPVQAVPITYTALLDGPSESPVNNSPGTGKAVVVIDTDTNFLGVDVLFSNLIGTTTASHIHATTALPFTGTAGVATQTPFFVGFPIGVTAGIYSNTFDLSLASTYNPAFVTLNGGVPQAEQALSLALANGEAYLNIHTTFRPGGEIRGFLVAVPEPVTAITGLLGLAGVGLALRRRHGEER